MKVKKHLVLFTKEVEVAVYAPADATEQQVREAAENSAETGLEDWDDSDWSVSVLNSEEVIIPKPQRNVIHAEYRSITRNPWGYTTALSDSGAMMVNAIDATWWQVIVSRFSADPAVIVRAKIWTSAIGQRAGFVCPEVPGLGIAEIGKRAMVVHLASGHNVTRCWSVDEARQCVTMLGSVCDWTLPADEIQPFASKVRDITMGNVSLDEQGNPTNNNGGNNDDVD